jgi:hypothetical protein
VGELPLSLSLRSLRLSFVRITVGQGRKQGGLTNDERK